MAGKPSDSTDREEEVFTDLHGNVDEPAPIEDGGGDLDDLPATLPAKQDKELDPDLEVVDDEPVAPAITEAEPEPEVPEPVAAPQEPEVVEFDPKDAQNLALRARNLELRKAHATSAQTSATASLERAKAAYLAAQESGDSKAALAAWEEFADAKVALARVADAIASMAGEENGLRDEFNSLAAKAPKDADGKPIFTEKVVKRVAPQPSQPNKIVAQFLKSNQWFSDPKHAAKATVMRGLDAELASEGKIEKGSAAYFAELGRRFNRVYPGVYKGLDGKPIATGQRERGRGAGDGAAIPSSAGGGSGTRQSGTPDPKSIRLTSDDIKQMAKFGFEDTPANRRTWLTEKRAMASQGAN